MKNIGILDTSVWSQNIGDDVIVDSIFNQINPILKNARVYRLVSQDFGTKKNSELIKKCDLILLFGTNGLSHIPFNSRFSQVRLTSRDQLNMYNKLVIVGAGWRGYNNGGLHSSNHLKNGILNSFIFRKYIQFQMEKGSSMLQKLISSEVISCVRDPYSLECIKQSVNKDVLNTSCPTVWSFSKDMRINTSKENSVVFTVTEFKKDIKRDKIMVDILFQKYEGVYFFGQMPKDKEYMISLLDNFQREKIKYVPENLVGYDEFLSSNKVDYVGSRLHGGIRAMQHNIRTIIIAIDNRALEIGRDIGLNIIERENISDLDYLIDSKIATSISLDLDSIEKFKISLDNYINE